MSVSDTGCRIAEEHLPRLFDRFYRVCGTDGGKAGGLPARFSVLSRPKPGEEVSGDAYFIRPLRSGLFFSVIDALGHGEEAHKTAVVARELLEECFTEDLAAIADTLHRGLRHTRGAAAGFGRIRLKEGVAEHLCIGNVELRIYQGGGGKTHGEL